jgi:alpha-L-arabinofuranosidase
MKKHILFFLTFALLTLNITLAQDTDDVLQVDAAESWGAISPLVYGASYGPWALVSPEMNPQAAASGLRLLRYPGGNWGDQNDIRHDQLDLFMIQARAWNAEPSVSTRVIGGSPEKSAELVHYANVEKDYNIRYWTIGNEPTLYLDDGYTIDSFNQVWREHAEAMLAVDPDILLVGPEVHQYPSTENYPAYLEDMRVWVRAFLEANGDLVDIVSIHRYPFPKSANSSATTDDLRANTPETDTMIDILRQDIRDTLGHDLPVAITEMNSHYTTTTGGEASPDSFYNAIWWADVLGRFIRQKVEMVSYFNLYTTAGSGFGLLGRYEPRPTYYVYLIYQRFGSELLAADSSDPDLSIYAARREDGTLTLILINRAPDGKSKTLSLNGFTPDDQAEVWRFDADHNAEQIESVEIADGSTIAVPGQSITLYVLPGSAS